MSSNGAQQIGLPQQRLDEIELRLAGADHRPWELNRVLRDENNRALITQASAKALRKTLIGAKQTHGVLVAEQSRISTMLAQMQAVKADLESGKIDAKQAEERMNAISQGEALSGNLAGELVKPMALFKLCDKATEDMAEFVAHAPRDIEDLLAEVKFLRTRYRDAEKERDEFKKEMLSLRVEGANIKEKLATMRRLWREFVKEIG